MQNVILPVPVYGCETWSPIPRKEPIFRVFENGLRMMYGGSKLGMEKIT
jgi:hypothetical protein